MNNNQIVVIWFMNFVGFYDTRGTAAGQYSECEQNDCFYLMYWWLKQGTKNCSKNEEEKKKVLEPVPKFLVLIWF